MADVFSKIILLLEKNNANYRVCNHNKEGRSKQISRIRGNKPSQAMKAIVVSLKGGGAGRQNALAVVPGHLRLNMKAVNKLLGAQKGSFATENIVLELTGCETGAIPPFSFNEKLKLIVDIRCQENEEVVFNAGRLDKSIFIKFADYKNISNATFSDIALEN